MIEKSELKKKIKNFHTNKGMEENSALPVGTRRRSLLLSGELLPEERGGGGDSEVLRSDGQLLVRGDGHVLLGSRTV